MNIIFDVGMVLADFRWRGFAADKNIPEHSVDLIEERMILDPIWSEFDRGVIPFYELIDRIAERFTDIPDDYRRFWDDITGLVRAFDYSEGWLRSLKEQGHRLYLLSNYSDTMFEIHSRDYPFMKYLDGKIISGEYHIIKPDPEIYKLLLNTYSLDPSESVFIDDRPENTAAAEKLGIKAITFRSFEQAENELDEYLRIRG